MKNYLKITLAAAVLTLMGCEPEFDNPVTTEGYYTAGSADFSTYVAVGNSLTSGYADGALYITGQENSYPNIMAQQFAFVGGGEFTQPLMADNLGGLLLNGTQVASNRLVLAADAMGNPTGPVTLEGNPTTEVTTSANGPFNNMGVPGAKSFHLVTPGYGAFNPFYARFQTSATASILEDAVSLNPSFFTLWIGSNDILGYATSGGSGVDQTGNL
ncbi:MAG: G-D-S-L family lipolytic protein, partial [Marinirhabdus sp.]